MANVTIAGATYSDVPAIQVPSRSGTVLFYETKAVTYNLSGGATASISTSEVVTNQGFSVKLTAPTGYNLNNVTVTMGGVDITSQVFTPDEAGGSGGGSTLIAKNISANGAYSASSDNADGYSSVTVTVPNSYAAGDEGKVVSNGALVSQGSDTVTTNGTVDTTLISSLTVNVSGGTGKKTATGTWTPESAYTSKANRKIVTTSMIGFTPSQFILKVSDLTTVSGTQYAILRSSYDNVAGHPMRVTTRYTNASNTLGTIAKTTSWTTQTDCYLYLSNGTIYLRNTTTYIIPKVEYTWYAIE